MKKKVFAISIFLCSLFVIFSVHAAESTTDLEIPANCTSDELWTYLEEHVPIVTIDQITKDMAGSYVLVDSIARNVEVDQSLSYVTCDMYFQLNENTYRKHSLWGCFWEDEDLERYGCISGKDVISGMKENDHLRGCYMVYFDGSFGSTDMLAIKKLEDIDINTVTLLDPVHLSPLEKVPNDVTGKWFYTTLNQDIDVIKFAKSYYENNFHDDKEIHAIINRSNGTTTSLKILSGLLWVDVYKYVEGEEKDAKILFGGEWLAEYTVDLDTGKIERIV